LIRPFRPHLFVLPALAALLVGAGLLAPFDTRMYDQLMRLHQRAAPPEIVLIRIDAEAERRYPDFVDRRPLALARLVDRLNQVKPRVIGVYLAFDPRDPRDREGLEVLREALVRHGNTVGKAYGTGDAHHTAEEAFRLATKVGFTRIGLQRVGVGDDNVVRGGFLAAPLAGAMRPSFALALLQQAGDLVPAERRVALEAAFESPTVEDDAQAIAFLGGAGSVRTISAADVLDGTVHPDAWEDRIAVIGHSEQDAEINLTTAVSSWAADDLTIDEYEAQFAAALLTGHTFRELPRWANALLVGGLLLAFGGLIHLLDQRRAVLAGGVAFALVLVGYIAAYRMLVWVPPVALLIALPLQFVIEFTQRFSSAASKLASELAVLRRESGSSETARADLDFDLALRAVREAIGSIRRQREYVHRLIDVQPAAIVVIDAQQRVRLSNAQALAWRQDPEAPTGTLREWLAAVDLRLPADAGQYLGSGSARLLAQCGEREVVVAFEPLPAGRDPQQHDMLVSVTELTGLMADQRERQAAIDFLSHDLRAPAHALIELCAGAQDDPGLAPPTRQILQTAERLARRMVQMATTYLDFVRSASPEAYTRAEPVLLADVVTEATETSTPEAGAKQVRLVLSVEDGEPGWIIGDAALLRRAVENLLGNAVKVTPPGGRVDVRLERRGAALAVIVRDEGPGIAPSRRSQLFQRFGPLARQPKSPSRSVGLGLAMVMSVVARHRGTVFVDNRPEGGAEFRIELPLEREAEAA
jgi:signal transduction histidine kinase/CHASE2 domain-containing sensor protein